jgi:hypothetical protein
MAFRLCTCSSRDLPNGNMARRTLSRIEVSLLKQSQSDGGPRTYQVTDKSVIQKSCLVSVVITLTFHLMQAVLTCRGLNGSRLST